MARKIFAGILAATLISVTAVPATAQSRTLEVDVSGLDMTTQAGARIALNRIKRAADKVCGARTGLKSLEEIRIERSCVESAVDDAIRSIGGDPRRQIAVRDVWKG